RALHGMIDLINGGGDGTGKDIGWTSNAAGLRLRRKWEATEPQDGTVDLSRRNEFIDASLAHPAKLTDLSLRSGDEYPTRRAGQDGQGEASKFRLPERPWSTPIARALVEQRRILALDGDAQASVLTALDALTLAREQFNMEGNVYLGLRAIFWQLARAKSDD